MYYQSNASWALCGTAGCCGPERLVTGNDEDLPWVVTRDIGWACERGVGSAQGHVFTVIVKRLTVFVPPPTRWYEIG